MSFLHKVIFVFVLLLIFLTNHQVLNATPPSDPKLSALSTAKKVIQTTVQAMAPSVALTLVKLSNNTTLAVDKNPQLIDTISIRVQVNSFDKNSINLVSEVGAKMVDSNGVIFALTTLNATGTVCTTGCLYTGPIDMNYFKPGPYKIYGYAKTVGGILKKTAEYAVTLPQTKFPPKVAITSPVTGSTVSGVIAVSFNATDNIALTAVSVRLDGQVVFSGKNSPATFSIDTRNLTNGLHTLYAYASDIYFTSVSPSVVLNVSNTIPLAITVNPSPISGGLPSLDVSDNNPASNIFFAQSGNNILVSTDNSNWKTYAGPFQSLSYRGNSGTHNVTVLGSVAIEDTIYCARNCNITANGTLRNTIVTLDPAVTHGNIVVNANNKSSAWVQTNDAVNGVSANRLHRFDMLSFPAEPSDNMMYGSEIDRSSFPLWGPNPSMSDVNQGALGDCYFLAPLASIAGGVVPNTSPAITFGNMNVLRELAVELPDGRVITQWKDKQVANKFAAIVVTKKLPPFFASTGPKYNWAAKGIWVPILEKAFAYYRYGQNTYNSIQGGYIWEAVEDFGFTDTWDYNYVTSWMSSKTYQTLPLSNWRTLVNTSISNKQVVTLGSWSSSHGAVIGSHAYSFLWVRQVNGQNIYTVRNPWGFDPSGGIGGGVLEFSEADFLAGYGWEDHSLNLPY